MTLPQGSLVETEPVEVARREVLDQHIESRHEPQEQLAPLLLLEVQGD